MQKHIYDTHPHFTPGEPHRKVWVCCSYCHVPTETWNYGFGGVVCPPCEVKRYAVMEDKKRQEKEEKDRQDRDYLGFYI